MAFLASGSASSGLAAALVLGTCACLHTEGAGYVTRGPTGENRATQDLLSTWLFAVVLVSAPAWSGAAPVRVDAFMWLRGQRAMTFKQVFTTATTSLAAVLACLGFQAIAGGALPELDGTTPAWTLIAIAAAAAAFFVLNTGLVAGALLLANPGTSVGDLLDRDSMRIEAVTLAFGAVIAGCWVSLPVIVPLALPALLLLQRSLLHGQLLHEARSDAKTGLPHAVAWRALAERELGRAAAYAQPAGVLLVDIDHFKAVNDAHGHLAGDDVLVAVARCLARAVRDGDTVGRFGGEEFAVLLPGADAQEAAAVAERLRSAVAGRGIDTVDGGISVTVSVGGATFPDDGRALDDLLGVADSALYSAKAAGRNRVVMPGPLTAPTAPTLSAAPG